MKTIFITILPKCFPYLLDHFLNISNFLQRSTVRVKSPTFSKLEKSCELGFLKWDNSPHHQHIKTFPHHKHTPKIEESEEISLEDILKLIEEKLEMK
ncbi:hypothetical protein J7K55_00280 [Candidatus Aerophobetes bacterium]|nr:hypothetical protein [Candidatus Aerophobetes bacterium]